MFIGVFKNMYGKIENYIYYSFEEWHVGTFSPIIEIKAMILFKIKGKNYTERKASLEDLAIEYSNNTGETCLSYGELMEIGNFSEKNGKRYGLLKEFRENGIC